MKPFEAKDYKVFDMFNNQWGLVTAGDPSHYNTCTIAWGSLGTIWGGPGQGRSIVRDPHWMFVGEITEVNDKR